jgi:uncharacterized protein
MIKFDGFEWDNGNISKCAKHGLTCTEIEAAFLNDPMIAPDFAHSKDEDRLIAIGKSHYRDKPIFVAFTLRYVDGVTLLRPISARPMHNKEIVRYAK